RRDLDAAVHGVVRETVFDEERVARSMVRVEIESEAVFVLRLGALRLASEDDRAERRLRARVEMRGVATRRRVAEDAGVRIFVVIVAMIRREAQRGVHAYEVRVHRRGKLPLRSVFAMVRRGDERGVAVVRIRRNAEVVFGVAAG